MGSSVFPSQLQHDIDEVLNPPRAGEPVLLVHVREDERHQVIVVVSAGYALDPLIEPAGGNYTRLLG